MKKKKTKRTNKTSRSALLDKLQRDKKTLNKLTELFFAGRQMSRVIDKTFKNTKYHRVATSILIDAIHPGCGADSIRRSAL